MVPPDLDDRANLECWRDGGRRRRLTPEGRACQRARESGPPKRLRQAGRGVRWADADEHRLRDVGPPFGFRAWGPRDSGIVPGETGQEVPGEEDVTDRLRAGDGPDSPRESDDHRWPEDHRPLGQGAA